MRPLVRLGAESPFGLALPSATPTASQLYAPRGVWLDDNPVYGVYFGEHKIVGADAINDVWALRQPGARDAVAAHPRCGVCLMHMHGEPETMQVAPMSGDPIAQVLSFWKLRVADLRARGIEPARISLDPGIGFVHGTRLAIGQREHDLFVQWLQAPTIRGEAG